MVEPLTAFTTASREYDLIGPDHSLEYYLYDVIGQNGWIQKHFHKLHINFNSHYLNFQRKKL